MSFRKEIHPHRCRTQSHLPARPASFLDVTRPSISSKADTRAPQPDNSHTDREQERIGAFATQKVAAAQPIATNYAPFCAPRPYPRGAHYQRKPAGQPRPKQPNTRKYATARDYSQPTTPKTAGIDEERAAQNRLDSASRPYPLVPIPSGHAIAYARLGKDVGGVPGVITQFAPQLPDKGAQQLRVADFALVPDILEQLVVA